MRFLTCLFALGFIVLAASPPALAVESRTSGRAVTGDIHIPDHILMQEPYAEFLPETSNFDVHNEHPQQWVGQEWDVAAWEGSGWTPERAIKGFYAANIFKNQYVRGGDKPAIFKLPESKNAKKKARNLGVPVLVVGPRFYQLSDLDQIRTVKLTVDNAKLFKHGYTMVELQDWYNKKVVGTYTPRGLYMR